MKLIQINTLKEFENLRDYYYVSNEGKIFSNRTGELVELSQAVSKKGYLRFSARTKQNTGIVVISHRVVAHAFCFGFSAENYFVNHIDENKTNNNYKNLEWVTNQYNKEYSAGQKIEMIVNNNVIDSFPSQSEATRQTGIKQPNIGKVLKGERETAGLYDIKNNCFVSLRVGSNTNWEELEEKGIYRVYWKKL